MAEGVVSYAIHPLTPVVPPSARAAEAAAGAVRELQALCARMLEAVRPVVTEHLWHREPFDLDVHVPPTADATRPPCLVGRTRFGDCIDDEWLIVHLLRELTRRFEVAVAVTDDDGEFLLIESADVLPPWLDPDTSENRVFLCRGKLCIVPLPRPDDRRGILPDTTPTVARSLAVLRDHFALVDASPALQGPLDARLRPFPLRSRQLVHRARCHVPLGVAHVLRHCPQLVAPAVDAFYLRDSDGIKACATMQRFPPGGLSVTTTVRLTRYLYAQLVAQRFYPPKPFRLPPADDPSFAIHELGMKLACGFEMLCARHVGDRSSAGDKRWERYVANLTQLGYFRGHRPPSQDYLQLEAMARQAFAASEATRPAGRFSDRLEFVDPAAKTAELLRLPMHEQAAVSREEPDADDWLALDEPQNDEQQRARADAEAGELKSIVQVLTSFMEKSSGVAGVEMPDDVMLNADDLSLGEDDDDNDAPSSDDDDDDDDYSGDEDGDATAARARAGERAKKPKISFSMTAFAEAVDVMLGRVSGASAASSAAATDGGDGDGDGDDEDEDELPPLEAYMGAMDRELATTEVQRTDAGEPVAVDVNLVRNIVESVGAQHGLAGPVSNILGALNLRVPLRVARDDVDQGSDDE